MNNISIGKAFGVGIFIVVAFIVCVGIYYFFKGQIRQSNTYPITLIVNDAQGIVPQDSVTLAGVDIGQVSGVNLSPSDRKAIISLEIKNKFHIPAGSEFLITSNLISGSAAVSIIPPANMVASTKPGAYIATGSAVQGAQGLSPATIASSATSLVKSFNKTTANANLLLEQLSKTVAAVNKVAENPATQSSLVDTARNLNSASQQGVLLAKELRSDLAADNVQVTSTLHNINTASNSLGDVATRNKRQLDDIVSNLDKTSQQIAALSSSANSTLTSGGTLQNLSDTVANLKQATIKLNSIEADIESFTGDKDVQAELRQTLKNTAIASDNTRTLVNRLNAITGGKPSVFGRGDLKFSSRLDFTQNLRTNRFRTDFNVYAPFNKNNFALLGIYDLTGSNKLNFEFGQTSPSNKFVTYRAGVYDGLVGVGADYDLFGSHNFSVDLYDPNRLRADFRQEIPINGQSSVYLGLQDFPRTNGVTLGIQLKR